MLVPEAVALASVTSQAEVDLVVTLARILIPAKAIVVISIVPAAVAAEWKPVA